LSDYTKYGKFSGDKTEFIITRADTPAPWVNYISNGRYHGLVSHTGGGFSFYGSPRDNRITRWRYNALPIDRPGRYIILRDSATGNYWSLTWQPTFTAYDSFECRHGLYYTSIRQSYQEIDSEVLYFVPIDDDLEIWQVTLRNRGNAIRQFDIFAFVELCLGHALVDLINQPNDQHFNEVWFERELQILFATKRYWVKYRGATVAQANEAWDRIVFFASSLPIRNWDGSRDIFIGRWRSESNPLAVERGSCFNSEITAGDAVAALNMEIQLSPDEEKTFNILLGVVPKEPEFDQWRKRSGNAGQKEAIYERIGHKYRDAARQVVDKYRDEQTVNREFQRLRTSWRNYLIAVQVETPDEEMNTMLNVWNQYQTSVTFQFSRDASYYHGGMLFGRGFRDSCQDIMGPVIARPDWVAKRILEMARYQFADGSTFHLYHPATGGGEKTGHSDTPLWLPLAIIVYLKETGDFEFLQKEIPFYDNNSGSVLNHLYLAIDYTLSNLSERNLAKFGPGDWNDTLDYLGRGGKGESVWVSMFLAFILKETIELCNYIGEREQAQCYRMEYERLSRAINEFCWDGAWYIRGTNDKGEIIGSARNEEGRIFLNTQSWAVISGVAQGERAKRCMDSVKELLETPKGPKILHPAYTRIDPNIGLATRCVPGKKENGAVFNHPVSWAILAECLLGRAERAFEIYKKALPMNAVIDIDRYGVEPYVYAEYVTSPDHPTFGQASHSWLTGSSTWMLRDGLDYILGVRPTYNGLLIDPCIPADWREYQIQRRFRGVTYRINVLNPRGINKGVKKLVVAGDELAGNLIDLRDAKVQSILQGKVAVEVQVVLG